MRIAFLGDTHYCIPRDYEGAREPATAPDHIRYTPMTETVLWPLFQGVHAMEPDLVISSGDFVEGGLSSAPDAARREMAEGLAYFRKLSCPFLIARGTHDARDLFAELALPAMAVAAGCTFQETYLRYDTNDCTFLILDYQTLTPGNAQDQWLEAQLADSASGSRRIFVVAHAPVFLWGRHFFGDPVLMKRLDALFAAYPVEAYLCGHTHNQAVSFHRRQGSAGWVQLMASSVGDRDMESLPLEHIHVRPDFGPRDVYLWGILEDSAPGMFLLDVTPDGMVITWGSVAGESCTFTATALRAAPTPCEDARQGQPARLSDTNAKQVTSARILVYGHLSGTAGSRVSINGVALGELPTNACYAARRALPLPPAALAALAARNELAVTTPSVAEFAIGSFSLEATLADGSIVRSPVAPEILVNGDKWNSFCGDRRLVACEPGSEHRIGLY